MKLAILLFLIFTTRLNLFADWQMFMGNHYLTGNNDEIVPENNRLNWQFKAPAALFYPVPHKRNLIFVNCLDKSLYTLDEISGKIVWRSALLDSAPVKSAVTYKDLLLINAGDFIYVMNVNNGKIIWSRKEGVSVQLSVPIVIDDIVYYGSRKFFYARNVFNGHLIWRNDIIKIYGGTPIYWLQKIYFLSKNFNKKSSVLNAIDAKNGQILWQQALPSDPNIFTPVVYNNKVFIPSFNKLYAFNALTGEIKWEKYFNSNIASHTVFANGKLYLSLTDGKIYAIDPDTSDTIDSFINFNTTGANFIIVGETIFIPNENGELFAYDMNTKKIKWKFETGITNHKGFLCSQNGRIYLAVHNCLYSISTGILPTPSQIALSAPKEKIEINLKDNNEKPIDGEITVLQENKVSKYKTDSGKAEAEVEKDKGFKVIAEAKDHFLESITIKPEDKRKTIDINLNPVEENKAYVFDDIQFKYDSAELTDNSISTLKSIAKFLKENKKVKLEIRGHTDNIGSSEYNLSLSQRRAEKVKEFLVKNGVAENRLNAKGFGEQNPIAPNDTEEGRAKNRRTEFVLQK